MFVQSIRMLFPNLEGLPQGETFYQIAANYFEVVDTD